MQRIHPPKTTRGWLSRQHDGRYVFSSLKPVVQPMGGNGPSALYPMPGDRLWYGGPGMCQWGTERASGVTLELLESVPAVWHGIEVPG